MRTLIVGVGAIGGVIAARMEAARRSVFLATRTAESAATLRHSGLCVTGIGGDVSVPAANIAPLADHRGGQPFDLILLAAKAHDAVDVAPTLASMLGEAGTLLPIQNGGVSQLLSERLGGCVLGGLSNLGATMKEPGRYEQRNAGHLLIGELSSRTGNRVERIARWLEGSVEIRTTSNMSGAIWSKLLVNCSVTTLGALAGTTMRQYIEMPSARRLFDRVYDEALSVALAAGVKLETMLVNPVPPGWANRSLPSCEHTKWLEQLLAAYGDLKPSMLQDFERRRVTEIEFINGYVVKRGHQLGVQTPVNEAIVAVVTAITHGRVDPHPRLLTTLLDGLPWPLHNSG
jgi:2-dehydropantoate 2-reductase